MTTVTAPGCISFDIAHVLLACGRLILAGVVGETLAPQSELGPQRRLRIYLAGGIVLQGRDGESVRDRDLAGRQGRRLFVRLASRHVPFPQEDLADDLWGARRLLIRAHLAAGEHAAAVQAYLACRDTFRDELGVLPAPDPAALVVPLLRRGPSGQ
jgi:hypothetical protein